MHWNHRGGSNGSAVKSQQFVDVRDYLATIQTLNNGSRTRVVENVEMKLFAAGKRDRDGNFVVSIPTHKTHSSYGPARLLFRPHIYQYAKIYVDSMQSNFPGTSGPFFPTNMGKSSKDPTSESRSLRSSRRRTLGGTSGSLQQKFASSMLLACLT